LIKNTLKIVDALLRVETPSGPAWHRYNGDGYGEHEDGSPFDGAGVGRAWPLLTGERGHYELAAGHSALPYLQAMVAMCGGAGMLPEQIWDDAPIAERGLEAGRPTGSAMPLAWAHAEFIKLLLSAGLGRVYDCPRALRERYAGRARAPRISVWCQHAPVSAFFADSDLCLCFSESARLRWRAGDGGTWQSLRTEPVGLGFWAATLANAGSEPGDKVSVEASLASGESVAIELVARGTGAP